jgi:hypothetical protein
MARHVLSHFSLPETNVSLKHDIFPNKKFTMGLKFGCVIDDQILISNLEKHN